MKTNKTKTKIWISIALILTCTLIAFPVFKGSPVSAQVTYQTPTPGEDGRIIYSVQAGDNCTRVYLLTGVTIEQLISLNGLDETCGIYEGQKLLLGTVEVPKETATAIPTLNPLEITPTATPSPGYGKICIVLFNDVDGTGMRSETELYLAGGEVSLNNRLGTVSKTGTTIDGDPEVLETEDLLCFDEIPEGDYNVTVAIPDGYNATTVTNYPLTLKAGNLAVLDFGAQVATTMPSVDEEVKSGRSPVLAIIGGAVLLSGIGLGAYMLFKRRG